MYICERIIYIYIYTYIIKKVALEVGGAGDRLQPALERRKRKRPNWGCAILQAHLRFGNLCSQNKMLFEERLFSLFDVYIFVVISGRDTDAEIAPRYSKVVRSLLAYKCICQKVLKLVFTQRRDLHPDLP